MHNSKYKLTRNIKKWENMAQSQEQNKFSKMDCKEVNVYELPNKDFQIIMM
jgi:hypothetical protein